MTQTMYQKHIIRVQTKINNGENVDSELKTMSNMIKGFYFTPEFYSLPKEVIFTTFSNSSDEFNKKEATYAIEWLKFVLKKKNDAIYKNLAKKSVFTGFDIVNMMDGYEKWTTEDMLSPPKPFEPTKNDSLFIIEMTEKENNEMIQKMIAEKNIQMKKLKEEIESIGKETADANKVLNKGISEMLAEKSKQENKQIELMKELKSKSVEIQKKIDFVKKQSEQKITAESHKERMVKAKLEHRDILQELDVRFKIELGKLQDMMADVNGGKTSKEIEEEREEKANKEFLRKKRGIPVEFADFFPEKVTKIKQQYKLPKVKKPSKVNNIFDAIILNKFEAVKEFVEKDSRSVKLRTEGKLTPLHQACKSCRPQIAEYLIENGANINAKDANSNTPFHYACAVCSDELVKLLMAKGAITQPKNNDNKTPSDLLKESEDSQRKMLQAFEKGGEEGIKVTTELFTEHPSLLNHSFNKGMRPIHLAASFGNPEIIELLLKYGVDIDCYDNGLNTPLHYAAMFGKTEAIKFLLSHGANFQSINADNKKPHELLKNE